jgi:hypothetical protein
MVVVGGGGSRGGDDACLYLGWVKGGRCPLPVRVKDGKGGKSAGQSRQRWEGKGARVGWVVGVGDGGEAGRVLLVCDLGFWKEERSSRHHRVLRSLLCLFLRSCPLFIS